MTREKEQATGSKIDAAMSVGTAVLGALFGRKVVSATSASRASTAMRKAGNVQRQSGDVQRATETLEQRQAEIGALDAQLQADIAALDTGFDAQTERLEEISVRPQSLGYHRSVLRDRLAALHRGCAGQSPAGLIRQRPNGMA